MIYNNINFYIYSVLMDKIYFVNIGIIFVIKSFYICVYY